MYACVDLRSAAGGPGRPDRGLVLVWWVRVCGRVWIATPRSRCAAQTGERHRKNARRSRNTPLTESVVMCKSASVNHRKTIPCWMIRSNLQYTNQSQLDLSCVSCAANQGVGVKRPWLLAPIVWETART